MRYDGDMNANIMLAEALAYDAVSHTPYHTTQNSTLHTLYHTLIISLTSQSSESLAVFVLAAKPLSDSHHLHVFFWYLTSK